MMLDNYVRDFKALIDWIQLQEKLEDRCSKQVMILVFIFIATVRF